MSTHKLYLDDARVMIAARQEARRNFDQNRRVAIDTGMQINHAIEVANILRHNLVQGAREDGDESAKWRTWNNLSPGQYGGSIAGSFYAQRGPLLSNLWLTSIASRTPDPRRDRAWRQRFN